MFLHLSLFYDWFSLFSTLLLTKDFHKISIMQKSGINKHFVETKFRKHIKPIHAWVPWNSYKYFEVPNCYLPSDHPPPTEWARNKSKLRKSFSKRRLEGGGWVVWGEAPRSHIPLCTTCMWMCTRHSLLTPRHNHHTMVARSTAAQGAPSHCDLMTDRRRGNFITSSTAMLILQI